MSLHLKSALNFIEQSTGRRPPFGLLAHLKYPQLGEPDDFDSFDAFDAEFYSRNGVDSFIWPDFVEDTDLFFHDFKRVQFDNIQDCSLQFEFDVNGIEGLEPENMPILIINGQDILLEHLTPDQINISNWQPRKYYTGDFPRNVLIHFEISIQ